MTDLSHWDFAERFKGKEAAELIMGILPGQKINTQKIIPVLRRMERDYQRACSTIHSFTYCDGGIEKVFEFFPHGDPTQLLSDDLVEVMTNPDCLSDELIDIMFDGFQFAYFDRNEIQRWLNAIGMKSVYQFHKNLTEPDEFIKSDIDPADLPDELSAANIAFRAITNGYGDPLATFKNRLMDYLEKNFPDLSNEAVNRIATVANPDKATGRKKSSIK